MSLRSRLRRWITALAREPSPPASQPYLVGSLSETLSHFVSFVEQTLVTGMVRPLDPWRAPPFSLPDFIQLPESASTLGKNWRPGQIFNEGQKARLVETNRQAQLRFLKSASCDPQIRTQFVQQAIDFQVRHAVLRDHDGVAHELSDVPFWYALALYQCAFPMNDDAPVSAQDREAIRSTMTFLLEQVSQALTKATLTDVIVIHLLCDSLLNRLDSLQDQLQNLLVQRDEKQAMLKKLAGQQAGLSRVRNMWHTRHRRKGLKRELKELRTTIAQVESQCDQCQTFCSAFAGQSPLTRLLRIRMCKGLLTQDANSPDGLSVIACDLNAEGLQRRLVQELVDACANSQRVGLQDASTNSQDDSFQYVGRVLRSIYEAAVARGQKDPQQYQGFLFLLYFYRIFALSVQGREKDFMDQMPESVQDRERYYKDLVDLLEPLRRAYETVASAPRAFGAIGRFRDEYNLYKAEGQEENMNNIRQHVYGSRLIGPQVGEVTS